MIRFRPLLWPTLATLAALALLIALGTWQLERRQWKHDLIDRVTERTEARPVALPDPSSWPTLDPAAWEYRPVVARGVFDDQAETLVFTSLPDPKGPHGGPGYWVMTPLALAGGGTVLVNRGFVPARAKSPAARAEGRVDGIRRVEGLLRLSERPGLFTPEPAADTWYVRDVAGIARARGIADPAPFFVDALGGAPGGLPQGGETRLDFRDDHLGYALTWYGLAAALAVVYLAFHRARGRFGRARADG